MVASGAGSLGAHAELQAQGIATLPPVAASGSVAVTITGTGSAALRPFVAGAPLAGPAPVVYHVILNGAGPVARARMEVRLWTAETVRPVAAGRRRGEDVAFEVAGEQVTHADAAGRWAVQLERNAGLDVPGTFYRIREWPEGTRVEPRVFDIVVPPGTASIYDAEELIIGG
jgi:hypothetical protein